MDVAFHVHRNGGSVKRDPPYVRWREVYVSRLKPLLRGLHGCLWVVLQWLALADARAGMSGLQVFRA